MNSIVTDKLPQVAQICRKYRVVTMYLFGSVTTGTFNEKSDIDVMVSFGDVESLEYFDNLISFKQALEKLFARSVDLLEESAIRNPVLRRSIERNKQLVYGRTD